MRALSTLVVAAVAVGGTLSAVDSQAQVIPPLGSTTTTTTTAPGSPTSTSAPSTTTTTPAGDLRPPTSTTSTSAPASSTTTTAPGGGEDPRPGPGDGPGTGPGDDAPAPGGPGPSDEPAETEPDPAAGDGGGYGVLPPGAAEIINSYPRTPPSSTRALLAALAPLVEAGMTETEAAVVGFGRFPVAGLATYSHDWLYPRWVPSFHFHEGTDIFAAHGTPVRAPADGRLRLRTGAISGLAAYVHEPDGTYWFMGHLAAFAPGVTDGQEVTVGTVVGYVGDSGNARGGAPHVHFEYHPGGGGPVDPKGVLDAFLAEAIANAPLVVAAHLGTAPRLPRPSAVLGLTRRLDATAVPQRLDPPRPPKEGLLFAAAANPVIGPVHLAGELAAEMADAIDWEGRARERELARAAVFERDRLAGAILRPLTPPALRGVLGPSLQPAGPAP